MSSNLGGAVIFTGLLLAVTALSCSRWAERSMTGMRRGRYRMHLRDGRKLPCYPNKCGCAWRNEMEDAA